ncbi:hypothetical protein Tco_0952671 [Tanacetum coccineum]|uniref:Uncharacterized protein n=1 Tax=Tanacetum coccineum TaxID=301880 RepID=A0ABQ5DXL6_9ASTR
MGYYFYFPPENKIVVARYVEFFEKNLITPRSQMVGPKNLEEIQDEDTSPSEITSEIPMEVEGFEPPQEEEILIRRSERTRRAPNRLCLNVESIGVHIIDAMNAKYNLHDMDKMYGPGLDLPRVAVKTVHRSQWIFKKKIGMECIVSQNPIKLVFKQMVILNSTG